MLLWDFYPLISGPEFRIHFINFLCDRDDIGSISAAPVSYYCPSEWSYMKSFIKTGRHLLC